MAAPLILAATVAIVIGVRRHQYVKALRERGWQFESNPSQAVANGLLVPPFGVGFRRGTDEHIVGQTRYGVDFQVFEYEAAGDARVVCMPLGLPLPELVVTGPGQVRMGARGADSHMLPGGGLRLSQDPTFAEAFMGLAGGAIEGFGARYPLSLAVDGDQLTQVGLRRTRTSSRHTWKP